MSEGLIFHPVICLSFYSSIHPFFLSPSLPSFIPSSLLFFLFFLPFSPSFHPFIHPYIRLFTHLSICSSSLPPFLLSFHHPSYLLPTLPSSPSIRPFIHYSLCSSFASIHPSVQHTVATMCQARVLEAGHTLIEKTNMLGSWEAECDWGHCDVGTGSIPGAGGPQVSARVWTHSIAAMLGSSALPPR